MSVYVFKAFSRWDQVSRDCIMRLNKQNLFCVMTKTMLGILHSFKYSGQDLSEIRVLFDLMNKERRKMIG